MKGRPALLTIALLLGAVILAPWSGAQAQSAQEGPIEIEKCRTIDKPGSYKLVRNLATTGNCLVITANFVTIDLAGFSISGGTGGNGITTPERAGLQGIAVRNGSISGFFIDVALQFASNSIVEGLRVSGASDIGIVADGIVKGNIASANGTGISAAGTVTGNSAANNSGPGIVVNGIGSTALNNNAIVNGGDGIFVLAGSTAIGNTANINERRGIVVGCPSNVTNNTAVFNVGGNLVLDGTGCNNSNNVAP